jgi:hypothetical protein
MMATPPNGKAYGMSNAQIYINGKPYYGAVVDISKSLAILTPAADELASTLIDLTSAIESFNIHAVLIGRIARRKRWDYAPQTWRCQKRIRR